jgi:hypothetical protein
MTLRSDRQQHGGPLHNQRRRWGARILMPDPASCYVAIAFSIRVKSVLWSGRALWQSEM